MESTTRLKLKNLLALMIMASICAPPAAAWAHGVVGDYVFLEPLITEDPTPANELDIVEPGWARTSEGRSFALGNEIEKVLILDSHDLPRVSVGGGTNWSYQSPKQGPPDNGFDDLRGFRQVRVPLYAGA